jgi:transcriptional regulator with AAA-type ATPase domain/pSer/pThr/pTyr-binding forkhead associated (FHA) protein
MVNMGRESMTQFILVYTHPTEGEQRFELVIGRSYRIGSRPDNDIVIDQKDVSRRHAVLRVEDGTFHVTDLDSKNGTFINGAKTASETFNCGDMVHLSSARLVIVEIGTGSFPTGPEVISRDEDDFGTPGSEETQKFRIEASMEDVVSLLETTASAVGRGALAEPLSWAVDHLGFDGLVVLYRDDNNGVAMVSSAGDLGQVARKSGVLSRLAIDHRRTSGSGTRVRQTTEMGENLIVATVGSDHVLVFRYTGRSPAIGDLRSVIAAVNAVLGSGKVLGRGGAAGGARSAARDRSAGVPLNRIVGLSESILACKLSIAEAALQTGPAVITAERGSGASLACRCVHDLSDRAASPFVVIDLEGQGPDAIENRLLISGEALTGADRAEAGTLVLDHVGSMPSEMWEAVLGAIADRSGQTPRSLLILNPDPNAPSRTGADDTLAGSRVSIPSLRGRRDDIPILVNTFLLNDEGFGSTRTVSFTRAAMDLLSRYSWPGNVAELRAEIRSSVDAAHPGNLIDESHLSQSLRVSPGENPSAALDLEGLTDLKLAQARDQFERWLIQQILAANDGRQNKAAEHLGLSRAGLFKKMRKLGL